MGVINQILSENSGYLLLQGEHLAAVQRKTYGQVAACRTQVLGSNLFSCERCGHPVRTHRSCGNRHCPTCQSDKTEQWLESHCLQLLPVPYFLITFTLPAPCRGVAYGNQKAVYQALFFAASQSVKKLALDPRYLGTSRIAALTVLHTWGRQMQYHVHLHMLVAGGGLDSQGRWRSSRQDFFLPVMALSKIYRAKFREAMRKHGLLDQFPVHTWQEPFIVHCQQAGNGLRTLRYLSSYLFRVAISNKRIVRYSHETVTFRYKKVGGKQWKNMTVATGEFIHRFLLHVLPKGFVKVRAFGLWSPNASLSLEEVKRRITEAWEAVCHLPEKLPGIKFRVFLCPKCQGRMKLMEIHRPGAEPVRLSG